MGHPRTGPAVQSKHLLEVFVYIRVVTAKSHGCKVDLVRCEVCFFSELLLFFLPHLFVRFTISVQSCFGHR